MDKSNLLLIDGNSVAARSFYAIHMRGGVPSKRFQEREFLQAFIRSMLKGMTAATGGWTAGRAVLCLDHSESWRKAVFPAYKSHREEAKKLVPWAEYCDCLLETSAAMRESMPIAVMRRKGYEADDLIAALAAKHTGRVVVLTSDTDMLQLCSDRVSVYCQDKAAFTLPEPDVFRFLQVLTCCGDTTDDVPSIVPRRPDGKARFRFGEKTVPTLADPAGECGLTSEFWAKLSAAETEEFKIAWSRNKLLVDLAMSPVHMLETLDLEFGGFNPAAVSSFLQSRIDMGQGEEMRAHALMERFS